MPRMVVFTELQQAMGIEPKVACCSPKRRTGEESAGGAALGTRLDSQGLREAYVNEDVFNVGETITHDSTGQSLLRL